MEAKSPPVPEASQRSYSSFVLFLSLAELLIIVLYGSCTEFSEFADVNRTHAANAASDAVQQSYRFYQDVHVMIFVGFGFLMTFLKRHSWTSVALNFLVAAFVVQLSILVQAFFAMLVDSEKSFEKIPLDIAKLVEGDFAAGAVLISFGAVLGACSPLQLLLLATFEVAFYSLNIAICTVHMKAIDVGGSMYVHAFGAYFGLAASRVMTPPRASGHPKNTSGYESNLFAMIGTLFLWMYWPSFNGALVEGAQQHRVVINTVLSLTGSCVAAFLTAIVVHKRFEMEIVLNATLAGGVAIGSSADIVRNAGASLVVGLLGGALSSIGYVSISAWMARRLSVHDTCGVHNLHGLPGVLGAVVGVIVAASATSGQFGADLEAIWEERSSRSGGEQAGYQFFALVLTLVIAIVGGLITGFLVRRVAPSELLFDDEELWEVPEEGSPYLGLQEERAADSPGKEKVLVGDDVEPEEVHLTARPPAEAAAPEEKKQRVEERSDDWRRDEAKQEEKPQEVVEEPEALEDMHVSAKAKAKKKKKTPRHEQTGSEGEIEMELVEETARDGLRLPQNSVGQLRNSGF